MKRLYRSNRDRVLFGVAGGMAEYFDVDPTLVRVVLAALAMGGFGILLYIVAAVVIPERPYEESIGANEAPAGEPALTTIGETPHEPRQVREGANARTFGFVLVFVGLYFLLRRFIPISFGRLWPAVLIIMGAYLVIGYRGGRQ